MTGAAAATPQILNMKQPASRWRRHASCRRPANRQNPEPNIAKTMKTPNRTLPGAALAIFIALLTAFPTQAQRMPQDSWYLAKELAIGGPGKLSNPADVDVGDDGKVYVADTGNSRIQVLDSNGNLLLSWNGASAGVPGSMGNPGSFVPQSIAVGSDGRSYVLDSNAQRVLVFDGKGKFLRSLGQQGSAQGQFTHASNITVDDLGNVYVSQDFDVTVFDPNGGLIGRWGEMGLGDGQFNWRIHDICAVPGGKVAVRDASRIQIFRPDGTLDSGFSAGKSFPAFAMATDGSGNFFLSGNVSEGRLGVEKVAGDGSTIQNLTVSDGPVVSEGIAVAGDRVFIADRHNNRIMVVTTAGEFVDNWGSFGIWDYPSLFGLAIDDQGYVYLGDFDRSEIRKYDADFKLVKRFGSAGTELGKFGGLRGLAIGSNQRLYALEQNNNRVQIFDLDGNRVGAFGAAGSGQGQFNAPNDIAVGKDNKVYVADRDNHRIQIFSANGSYVGKIGGFGSFDGEFKQPNGVAVSPEGLIAVADIGNNRIQIFNADGNFQKSYDREWQGWGWRYPQDRLLEFSSDGLLYASTDTYVSVEQYGIDGQFDTLRVYSPTGSVIKSWRRPFGGAMAETLAGDLLVAHGDNVLRLWKRTFRTVHPEPANALPLPSIVSQKKRSGTSLVDVDYTVKDADNATVRTAALAFKDGGNSLADVIPITSFAEGTGNKLGANIATGQTHRFTWDAASDWSTDFGEVQLEILAKDGRGLLNLDFIQIPAGGDQPALKISRSPLNDSDFLSVWYWLIATADDSIRLKDGHVTNPEDETDAVNGFNASYFENHDFTGRVFTRVDARPIAPYPYTELISGVPFIAESISWLGDFMPAKTGIHVFALGYVGECQITVRGNPVQLQGGMFSVQAQEGVPVPISVSISRGNGGFARAMSFNWVTPPGETQRVVSSTDFKAVPHLAYGVRTTAPGRAFLYQKMGLREATEAEILRAKEAGTPGVINQWDPKLQVGPDERPAKINAYGFDTGADGYWVVPVSGN